MPLPLFRTKERQGVSVMPKGKKSKVKSDITFDIELNSAGFVVADCQVKEVTDTHIRFVSKKHGTRKLMDQILPLEDVLGYSDNRIAYRSSSVRVPLAKRIVGKIGEMKPNGFVEISTEENGTLYVNAKVATMEGVDESATADYKEERAAARAEAEKNKGTGRRGRKPRAEADDEKPTKKAAKNKKADKEKPAGKKRAASAGW